MEEVKREEGGLEKNVLVQMSSVLYFAGVSLVLALSLSLSLSFSLPHCIGNLVSYNRRLPISDLFEQPGS